MKEGSAEFDALVRQAAFTAVKRLQAEQGVLTAAALQRGFTFNGEQIPLINGRRGIWKPKRMAHLLSIKTVHPKPGGKVWYDDQFTAREQIYRAEEFISYAFQGSDAEAFDNQWMKEAMLVRVPVIYFFGIAPGRYEAILPVFIEDWSAADLSVRIAAGVTEFQEIKVGELVVPENAFERRYAMRVVKQRLHQASFREAVLAAYGGKCAISGLPEPRLLDAAHIISDSAGDYGAPVVINGLPLSKVHHAAFDAHFVGIDPDYKIHIADRLLDLHDGPILELGIKAMAGEKIRLPRVEKNRPDRDRLAQRFEEFRTTAA